MKNSLHLAALAAALFCVSLAQPSQGAQWRPGYEQNTGCLGAGGVVANNDNGPAQSDGTGHCVRHVNAQAATFFAAGVAYAAYTTPTDLMCLWGGANVTTRVVTFELLPQSTSASMLTAYFIKRVTTDTGGSPLAATPVAADSGDGAALSSLKLYGAAPTLGTAAGTLRNYVGLTTVLTAATSSWNIDNLAQGINGVFPDAVTFNKPVILHGAGEGVCFNLGGVALPGGFTAQYDVEWTEQ